MNKIDIKRVAIIELAQLQEIGKQTFAGTFSSGNSEAYMNFFAPVKPTA